MSLSRVARLALASSITLLSLSSNAFAADTLTSPTVAPSPSATPLVTETPAAPPSETPASTPTAAPSLPFQGNLAVTSAVVGGKVQVTITITNLDPRVEQVVLQTYTGKLTEKAPQQTFAAGRGTFSKTVTIPDGHTNWLIRQQGGGGDLAYETGIITAHPPADHLVAPTISAHQVGCGVPGMPAPVAVTITNPNNRPVKVEGLSISYMMGQAETEADVPMQLSKALVPAKGSVTGEVIGYIDDEVLLEAFLTWSDPSRPELAPLSSARAITFDVNECVETAAPQLTATATCLPDGQARLNISAVNPADKSGRAIDYVTVVGLKAHGKDKVVGKQVMHVADGQRGSLTMLIPGIGKPEVIAIDNPTGEYTDIFMTPLACPQPKDAFTRTPGRGAGPGLAHTGQA